MNQSVTSFASFWLKCPMVIDEALEASGNWRFKRAASSYAKVLLELLVTHAAKSDFQKLMVPLFKALQDSKVRDFCLNAPIALAKRLKVIKDLVLHLKLEKVALDTGFNLITALIKERRLNYLGSILTEFQKLCLSYYKLSLVKVYVATPLTSKELEEITSAFKRKFKRAARIEVVVQPKLLAGIVLEIGDRRIDNSLIAIANRLKHFLTLQHYE